MHQPGYVSEFRFLASQTEVMEARVEGAHSRLAGLSSAQAENRYLEKVKWLDMYGVDLHPVIVSPKTVLMIHPAPMTKCLFLLLMAFIQQS